MAVPKYNEFFPAFLDCLADGEVHTLKEIRAYCAEAYSLSDEDRQMMLPSGQNMLRDRVGWARTYLKKAGLIDSPSRANFGITDEGKKAVAKGTSCVTLKYLQQYEAFSEFYHTGSKSTLDASDPQDQKENSPQEAISDALSTINASLADDLLIEILKMTPYEFETLVIRLLIKMGYGSKQGNMSTVTQKSGDEGIDGIVTSDKFGFENYDFISGYCPS